MSKTKKDVFKEGIGNYSINLLWENKIYQESQKFIHISPTEQELTAKFLMPAIKWAKSNSTKDEAEVNIWHDSKLHTQQAIAATKEILETLAKEHNCDNIKFKDIREIQFINDNDFLFSQDIPLYFRVDFLKLIIQAHELITEGKDASIFADLEVGDLRLTTENNEFGQCFNKPELFDVESMDKLKKFGIIVNLSQSISDNSFELNSGEAPDNELYTENQFLQMVNNETAIEALQYLINANLMRAIDILNMPIDGCSKIYIADQKSSMGKMHEMPYYSAISEITKLYISLTAKSIKADLGIIQGGEPNKIWIEYDPRKHGYKPMGNKPDPEDDRKFDLIDYHSSKIYKSTNIINFGPINEDCISVRNTYTRPGNSHFEESLTIPEDGHEPFVAQYWPIEVVGDSIMI